MSSGTVVRELYGRFSRGDLDGVLGLCTDDIVFHVPGNVPFAGDHTRATFHQWIGTVFRMSEGTFGENLVDLMVGEQHVSALLLHTLRRGGRDIAYRTIHLWRMEGDLCAEWCEHPQDLQEFEAAWAG